MKIEHDREADALYIQFRPAHPEGNMEIEDGVTVDLDGEGHIVGIEILDASDRLGIKALVNLTIENMILHPAPP